jgi:hypothetical protein
MSVEPLDDALRRFVAGATGAASDLLPVRQLKGDASNRSYYRVGAHPSFVVMVMPLDAKGSEEKTKGGKPRELPFINVHRYLSKLGVRVPRILRYDEPAGLMLLEDLGDVTFEAQLLREPASRESLYGQAIDLLAALRARAERDRDSCCLAYTRAFDVELYHWELHHFLEWGLQARYRAEPTSAERARIDELFLDIARALDAEPKGFTHRDYQSRNLMVVEGSQRVRELAVIDFQDALGGPHQYDLVALLRDSYVCLERPFIEQMLARYLDAYERAGGTSLDRARFVQVFDLLTLQRKLKDAGRFEFIDRVKKNPGFLPYVEPSLGYVRAAFERVPEQAELRALLARYVPELR